MSLLSPWTAALAALIAVPLLLLLYMLKLRRRSLRLASTLLWRRSFQDLQANVPFQRLRASWLLALQLLLLLALILALGEPVVESGARPASRVILLVDRSASMSAADVDEGTRLEAARREGRALVQRLVRGRDEARIMIVSVGAAPRVVQGFDSRRDVLVEAIDAIERTDETADLAAALSLAGVFAQQAGGESESENGAPDVVFLSDGTVEPPTEPVGYALPSGRFRYVRVGPEPDAPVSNLGFVSLSARRDPGDPARVIVFARLVNAGPADVDTIVTLLIDDEPGPLESLRVPGAGAVTEVGSPAAPGEATVTFAIELPAGAVLGVRHSTRDALAADDTAAIVLPAPARPRIALVHGADGPDRFLRDLLEGLEPRSLRVLGAEDFAAFDPGSIDAGDRFDLIVFDRVPPPRLPAVPTITFGAVAPGVETTPAPPGGQRIVSWQRRHPVMRHVELDTIVYAGFGAMKLPPGATSLARGGEGPIIALLGARGAAHAVVGFSLARSNWPLHVSIAVFLQNLVEHLTLGRSGQVSRSVAPGEPASVRAAPGAGALRLVGGGVDLTVPRPTGEAAMMTLPPLPRAGIYRVEGVQPPDDRLAVSLLSDVESDIRPAAELVVNAEAHRAGAGAAAAARPVWPWFVGAAVALLVMEWLVYCRRFRT